MYTQEGSKKVKWTKVEKEGPPLTWYKVMLRNHFSLTLIFKFLYFGITWQMNSVLGIQIAIHHVFFLQTYFDAPEGGNPVAVRMTGMNKGMIWINGKGIGRYWMSYVSPLGQPTQSE